MKICYWPDGTWCEWDELEAYLRSMSDDFTTAVVDFDTYEEIDQFVQEMLK